MVVVVDDGALLVQLDVFPAVAANGERLTGMDETVDRDGRLLARRDRVDGELGAGIAVPAGKHVRLCRLVGKAVRLQRAVSV